MRRLGIATLVVGLVLGGLLVADVVTRSQVESGIEADLRTAGLADAEVVIPGRPFLTQLLAGRFDRMEISAARVDQLDDLRVSLSGVATRAPHTAETLKATAELAPQALALGPDLDVTVVGGAIVVALRDLPLSATVLPGLRGEVIELEVTALTLADVEVAPGDLPLGLGEAFEGLELPVPTLPEGVRLTGVAVVGDTVRVDLEGTDVALADLAVNSAAAGPAAG